MKATLNEVIELAKQFLALADELNEHVSRYFDGSDEPLDVASYYAVSAADKKFVDAVNDYWGENDYKYGLNYELAEYFIY